MSDREQFLEAHRDRYSWEFRAPYEGVPDPKLLGLNGNFVWVSFKEDGHSIFLLEDRKDLDCLSARYTDHILQAV